MANTNNIRIELLDGQGYFDYRSAESLGIKLNRVVENYADPSKRYGDWSFTFNLPKTKNNDKMFEFPDMKGRNYIFVGKIFQVNVYNNNKQLLQGTLELVDVDDDVYGCRFYSKLTEFSDYLKEKTLQDLTYLDTIEWNYEQSIIEHLNVAPISDQIEFPMVFYKTPFMYRATIDRLSTPSKNYNEACLSYFYSFIVTSLPYGTKNPFYEAAFPPAIYLKAVIDGIFADAGWTYNSSFFERSDIQKIVIPFTGKGEDFTGAVIEGTPNLLNINKLLPAINQAEFLKTVMNAFNLYIIVDQFSKSVTIESYETLFANDSNPYPIDLYDVKRSKIDFENKLVTTEDDLSTYPLGFNRIMDYDRLNNTDPSYNVNTSTDIRLTLAIPRIETSYDKGTWDTLWNKTTGTKEIKLGVSPTNYYPYCIINERSITNATGSKVLFTVGIPLISKQLPSNNEGNPYAPDTGTTYVQGNDPTNYQYEGGLKLLYYYGAASYNVNIGGSTYNDWVYVLIATGGTVTSPTFAKCRVHVCSPFRLMSTPEYTRLTTNTSSIVPAADRTTAVGAEAHACLLTYFSAGNVSNTHTPTEFSLTWGEESIYENVYTKFHKQKYDDYYNNYILTGKMRMDENDWSEMQINRTLLYNDELYRLISIKNYDPIGRTADVELLKKLS